MDGIGTFHFTVSRDLLDNSQSNKRTVSQFLRQTGQLVD